MTDIKKILNNFGFSDNEIRVYTAMLKSGEAPVSRIATLAKLNRITVHHIVERLEARGFATRFNKGNTKVVRPAHPIHLQKRIHESSALFDKVVPELVATMRDDSNKSKPIVRMYYGVKGFEDAAEELLEKPNITIRHIGSLKEAHKFIGVAYDRDYFVPTRVSKNIHYKTIHYEGETKPVLRTTDKDDLREARYIPKGYDIPTNVFIVPGKTIIVTTDQELMTVVIESEDISNSEINKFELMWSLLK
ncbi:MAG: helix-turn-helix domain-containing protein [Patescibacteria group bacterium]|mgnify:CR=1 FL=1